MDNLTRFCAFALCFGAFILAVSFILWIFDKLDKYDKKKYSCEIQMRRQAFELDCQEAGKALLRRDEIQKLLAKPVRPIRKAVGYFSDEAAQALLR